MDILIYLNQVYNPLRWSISTTNMYAILISIVLNHVRRSTPACYDNNSKPLTCITSPINAATYRNITATNTCGKLPEQYCFIGPQRRCEVCSDRNPDERHPAEFMIDRFNVTGITWWQSQTWWESNNKGLSRMFEPLKVNISLSLNKKYLITGGIYIVFYTERPKQMIIERSSDYGRTWKAYQYYAKNCRSAYNLPADPLISRNNPYLEICSELYSGEFPRSGGVVHFDPRARYNPSEYFDTEVQAYLEATNIRLRLEYPGTDGREYINQEATLNQYYYAISDIRIDARCNCNGHGEYCDFINGTETCDCQHFTMGRDCELCQPLYRNRLWRAGNDTSSNSCEKCICYDHAISCTYNALLSQGICDNCMHNTRGVNCDRCVEKFFRNISASLNDRNVCIPCDCYKPGIGDDGKCLQIASASQLLGQCNCKKGILGRRCDQCVPGKWGFKEPPVGTCFDCACNIFGTLKNNQVCDQYSGQCTCKVSITGRQCDRCKNGYYSFPSRLKGECRLCECNFGGSKPFCDRVTGVCSCKPGVNGSLCDSVSSGFFFPNFTHIKFEPEMLDLNGTYSIYNLVRNYGRYFTGLGFVKLDAGQRIEFSFIVPESGKYFVLLRYSLYQLDWYSSMLPQGRENVDWSGSKDITAYLKSSDQPVNWLFSLQIKNLTGEIVKASSFTIKELTLGDDNNWISSSNIELHRGLVYKFSLEYKESSKLYGIPWPLLIDSFILMLDYNPSTYYTTQSINTVQKEIESCFTESRSLATTFNLPLRCLSHTFTIDLELYNKAFTCNCYQPGAILFTTCQHYGGQCKCKTGYGDRRCDQCIPGYYGDPRSSCSSCSCSPVGSLSLTCNKDSGICSCKANAKGRKCDECLLGFYDLDDSNPKGCQECFGYGHSISCTSATGFFPAFITSDFLATSNYDGWKLLNSDGVDESNFLINTTVGMEYTDQTNSKRYFNAPNKFLTNQLYSYGELLIIEMNIFPINGQPSSNAEWHVRLAGNNKTVWFKFLEEISKTRNNYTIRLHQDFIINQKMSEFDFKALLAQLTGLHIGVVYFKPPVRILLKTVRLSTAFYNRSNNNSEIVGHVENSTCEIGYKGLSCETCDTGYTRLIPNGGPLIECVLCSCNNRSKTCDPQSGICQNCRPGTTGRYCEKCMPNVLAPNCDRCETGFFGLYTELNGCRPCNCYLPGTAGGNNSICDSFSGQCVCNQTLNVGGRQCNLCKENAYNISLSEKLRCQECPVCYGLIENFILKVRQDFFQVKIEMLDIILTLSMVNIKPFNPAITTMQNLFFNLSQEAEEGNLTAYNLETQWREFDSKVETVVRHLSITGVDSISNVTVVFTAIAEAYSTTLFQQSYIRQTLIDNFFSLNETVQSKIKLQNVALRALQNLGVEMQNYVTMATTKTNNILLKKYDLVQKIKLSVSAARKAVGLSSDIRNRALNLSYTLSPVYSRGLQVENYAKQCIASISTWLTNATKAMIYAQMLLRQVEFSTPGYSKNITVLESTNKRFNKRYELLESLTKTLSRRINAVSVEITNLKTTFHLSQVDSIRRRSSIYMTNALLLRNTTRIDIGIALGVKKDAEVMLDTIQNFMVVTTKARKAANNALMKVDVVKNSVEFALNTAVSIRNQLKIAKLSVAQVMQVMSSASQLTKSDMRQITVLHESAINLHRQTQTARDMIEGNEIRIYIKTHVVPLISLCSNFKLRTNASFNSAKNALAQAELAFNKAVLAKQKISILSTNSNRLPTISTVGVDRLISNNTRIKTRYQSLNITSEITRLKTVSTNQNDKVSTLRKKLVYLHTRISLYKQLYQSLVSKTC